MSRFFDVSPSDPYAASIEKVAAAGIMVGWGGRFRPYDQMADYEEQEVIRRLFMADLRNLRRGEAADFIARFLEDSEPPDGQMTVFPVQGARARDFVDTWGAPRPGGRQHKGVDIFCRDGTPLLACEDGFITKIGDSAIGGLRLWIDSRWYYAHLASYGPGIQLGAVVSAGQIVGSADRTGDAKYTPCHLHLGWDPKQTSGENWANPYKILRTLLPLT